MIIAGVFHKGEIMKKSLTKQKEVQEGTPNRATYHHGSTTQGGSNFGQGSMQLGKRANKQGSEGNSGSNYGNEKKWNNEALRREDLKQQRKSGLPH
jgi:hypothetical protein